MHELVHRTILHAGKSVHANIKFVIPCSQFFRTTTEQQSKADAFDESRSVMTFLTILGLQKNYAVSD